MAVLLLAAAVPAVAQLPSNTGVQGFGLKIFRVESGLYPFVQVYIRTFDQNMQPLENLNELNIGVMVKGKAYSPRKGQYRIASVRNRNEATRSVLVLDCSKSMAGAPFEAALKAAASFIDSKRAQDQVCVLAMRDTNEGYEIVSDWERDKAALARRLLDVKCDANQTRLYDTIGAAMQKCAMVSEGGISTEDAEYIVSNAIVVFSDGKDEGSSITREDLNTRITNLTIPVPIYSLAYSKVDKTNLKNLDALSKNSFGIYYNIGEAFDQMQRTVENIQHIMQNDYVVVLRSYLPVDGEEHAVKIGVEYPSRSGKMTYQGAKFEAVQPPPVDRIRQEMAKYEKLIPALPDGDPYLSAQEMQAGAVPADAGATPPQVPAPAAAPAAPAAPPAQH
jgi:hypothetical protein